MGRVLVLGAACFAAASSFALSQLDDWQRELTTPNVAEAAPAVPERADPTPEQIANDVWLLREGWSSGGTLHNVACSEWVIATDENRLATAADWALAFPSVQVVVTTTEGADLLPYASVLQTCVSEAAAQQALVTPPPLTAELAAICAVELDWVKSPES